MKVTAIFISPGHNFVGRHGQAAGTHATVPVESIECVAGRGLRGDRYFDHRPDYKGQITFFADEVYEALCDELGEAGPRQACRRNVFTRGLNLNEFVHVEFDLQGIRFYGMEECSPCYWMNTALAPGAEAFLKGRGGLRAKILSDGVLRVNA